LKFQERRKKERKGKDLFLSLLLFCHAEKIVAGSLRLAHSIETYLIYFFKMRDWVTHEILDSSTPKVRSAKIAHFIYIAMVWFFTLKQAE
jgi:hypothetical protein